MAAAGGACLPVCRRQDEQRRSARAFLARGAALVPRPGLGSRQHGARRARACTRRPASATISNARSPGRPRSTAITPIRNGGYFLTADDAEGLVVRPNSTSDDAAPNPNAIAAQNLVRLAGFAGHHSWRDQVDRLFDGVLPIAADNLFMHVALLNALDLRLRAIEIVVAGTGGRRVAGDRAEAAVPRPHRGAGAVRRRVAAAASRARQARCGHRACRLCLRRRNLLAAGDLAGANCRNA